MNIRGIFLYRFLLVALLVILHTGFASATLITCPGRPNPTLNWSSSNVIASGCALQPSYSDPNCSYSPLADTSNSRSIANGTSCNVSLSCGPASSADTLQYHPELTWNGTSCVAATVVGTCSTMGASGNYPVNGCNSGTLGANAIQPDGSYQWYCNGNPNTAANMSPLCWYVPPAASCSANGPLSWGGGCGAYWTGTVNSGSSATVNNTNSGYTGSQTYSCNNGSWSFVGQSCTVNSCTNGATNPPTCNTCSAGYTWNGSSCVATAPSATSCSANGPLSWGGGCGAYWSGTINSGSSATVNNTNSGYTGYQTYSCNNGSWSFVSQSCSVAPIAFNGICNTPEYTCYAGSVGNMAYSNSTYTWTCSGGNGGSSVSCSYSYLPDLTATEVSIPGTTSTYTWSPSYTVSTTANAGTVTTFNSTIRNQGNATTGKSFYNFMQVATAANGGGTITDLVPSLMATLNFGTTNTTSATYTFPAGGTYSVRACADKSSSGNAGTITESIETNNCGMWTKVNVTGGAPQVVNSSLTGNNTAQGTLSFSCTYSTLYSVTRAEGPTGVFPITNAPYSGPVSINLTVAGNYSVICSNSTTSSSPVIYSYDPTPVSSGLVLVATPTTTKSGSMTTLSWNITSPTNTCSLTAAAVYPAGATTNATKEAAAATLTAQFTNPSQTDANDPYGQRAMLTALRTAAPGMTSSAIGKKTVVIYYTTDFTLSCGTSSARKVRVQVTNENEG